MSDNYYLFKLYLLCKEKSNDCHNQLESQYRNQIRNSLKWYQSNYLE